MGLAIVRNERKGMKILVVGASGATGRLLVEQLLERGQEVRAIVRSPERLPENLRNHDRLSVTYACLLDLSDAQIAWHVEGCGAVASCLGHNLTVKGIFGPPRRLVTDATRRLCTAIKGQSLSRITKFVLMNTTGNRNRDLDEQTSIGERCVVGLLRTLLPPQRDNEEAADYLRTKIGKLDDEIEWVAVRPDTLINEDKVTRYEVHASPVRSPIFNAGKTSRINVAHFMAELIADDDTWKCWKGQMPVIYNAASSR